MKLLSLLSHPILLLSFPLRHKCSNRIVLIWLTYLPSGIMWFPRSYSRHNATLREMGIFRGQSALKLRVQASASGYEWPDTKIFQLYVVQLPPQLWQLFFGVTYKLYAPSSWECSQAQHVVACCRTFLIYRNMYARRQLQRLRRKGESDPSVVLHQILSETSILL